MIQNIDNSNNSDNSDNSNNVTEKHGLCLNRIDIYNDINLRLDNLYSKYENYYIDFIKNNMKHDYIDEKNQLYLYQILVLLLETETVLEKLSTHSTLVSEGGNRWIKIIGSNIERVNNSIDENYYDKFCILDIVDKFIEQVQKSDYVPTNHKKEIIVIFQSMPNENVYNEMKKRDIIVQTLDNLPLNKMDIKLNDIVNLDVTVLITLCSEICNLKNSNIIIPDYIKKHIEARKWNDIDHIIKYKESLENEIKKYKKIIVCQTAWNTFSKLVELIGRENEKKRMLELQKIITIVEDEESERIKKIQKFNDQYQKVFGTGEFYNCMTFTGNSNYENIGIHIDYKFYPSVQLTEKDML
jgi:hypothetical protein